MKHLSFILCCVGCFWVQLALGQYRGVPIIKNYSKNEYKAAPENWVVVQDSAGFIYLGNQYGLFKHYGTHWAIDFQPENKSVIRSAVLGEGDTLYVGAQHEFGYLLTQANGQRKFQSLVQLIPAEYRNFDDIWKICCTSDAVWFQAANYVFRYHAGTIDVIQSETGFYRMHKTQHGVFVLEEGKGLMKLSHQGKQCVAQAGQLHNYRIQYLFGDSTRRLVATEKHGMFYLEKQGLVPGWPKAVNAFLKKHLIYCVRPLRNGNFAIGTHLNGLLIVDKHGHKLLHINEQYGLQNNAITHIFEDNVGNLWLALKNGLDYVEMSSPFSQIDSRTLANEQVYSTHVHQAKLYVGTSNGLAVGSWNTNKNTLLQLERSQNTVYNMASLGGELLFGRSDGAFCLAENKLKALSTAKGAWTFRQLAKRPNFMLCGTFKGLELYEKQHGHWVYRHHIQGFNESSRLLELDAQGNIWVAHGYKGIYKLRLSDALDRVVEQHFYTEEKGFPSRLFLSVFKLDNEIVFGTQHGVYRYDSGLDSMLLHNKLSHMLRGYKHIRLLKNGFDNALWFVADDQTGIIHRYQDGTFHVESKAFNRISKRYIPGFEHIHVLDKHTALFGTENGIYHFDGRRKKNYDQDFASIISQVELKNGLDSLIWGANFYYINHSGNETTGHAAARIAYRHNSLNFVYGTAWYEKQESIRYAYRLVGADTSWSAWTTQHQKEFTNMPSGNYTFQLKAKNLFGKESSISSFSFRILPPWYRSAYAYLCYLLVLATGFWLVFGLQKKRFKKEKLRMQWEQEKEKRLQQLQIQQEKLRSENMLAELKRAKLQAAVDEKNAKLAASTTSLVQKNETLQRIRDEINQALACKRVQDKHLILNKIVRTIDWDIKNDGNWQQFEALFNQIHDNFIQRLQAEFPALTPRDIKLCAYLRMNLNSKEMAPILGLSVRGIEDMRYRVRKKMNLDSSENLAEFILRF